MLVEWIALCDIAFQFAGLTQNAGTVSLTTGLMSSLPPAGTAGEGNGIAFTPADRLGAAVTIAAGFTVGARVSKLGTAGRGSGDIEGTATIAGSAPIKLVLDSVVP